MWLVVCSFIYTVTMPAVRGADDLHVHNKELLSANSAAIGIHKGKVMSYLPILTPNICTVKLVSVGITQTIDIIIASYSEDIQL